MAAPEDRVKRTLRAGVHRVLGMAAGMRTRLSEAGRSDPQTPCSFRPDKRREPDGLPGWVAPGTGVPCEGRGCRVPEISGTRQPLPSDGTRSTSHFGTHCMTQIWGRQMDIRDDLEALPVTRLPQDAAERVRRMVAAQASSQQDHAMLLDALGLQQNDPGPAARRCPTCATHHHHQGPQRRHQYCSRRCYNHSLHHQDTPVSQTDSPKHDHNPQPPLPHEPSS